MVSSDKNGVVRRTLNVVKNLEISRRLSHARNARLNSLSRQPKTTDRRIDRLKQLLSTNLVISQRNADRLEGRLFSVC